MICLILTYCDCEYEKHLCLQLLGIYMGLSGENIQKNPTNSTLFVGL
jgi:hypothetical protein